MFHGMKNENRRDKERKRDECMGVIENEDTMQRHKVTSSLL